MEFFYKDDQTKIPESFNELREELVQLRRDPIEENEEFSMDDDLESHLKDLGYME